MRRRDRAACALAAALLSAGCIKDTRATREDATGGISDQAPVVPAPKRDRCKGHSAGLKNNCEEAKYLAELYARRLSTGDAVCLEGGFGEEPGGSCMARAAVVDVDQGKVLIEIRDPRPESRWFKRVQHQIWFEEGALVDLYLAEHGY